MLTRTTDGGSAWNACEADGCLDVGSLGLQFRLLDDDGTVVAHREHRYCPYHCAVRERAIRATPERELHRLDVFTGYFDSWHPSRPYRAYNVDPATELDLLVSYLDAQDAADHTALESRRRGVAAARWILHGDTDMYGVIQHWDEPWKNQPRVSEPERELGDGPVAD